MRNIREIKAWSRTILHGHYTRLSFFILTHFFLNLIVSYIPVMVFPDVSQIALLIGAEALAYVITVLVDLLDIGLTKAVLSVVRMEDYAFGDIVYAYKNSRDSFLKIQLILTAITSVLNIPLLLLARMADQWKLGLYEYYLIYLGWVFFSTFLSMLITLRIRFSILVLIDHPDYTAGQALKESLRITRGRYGELLKLQLSFLGEYLLAVVSFYIGFLLVNSYIRTANAVYYEEISKAPEDLMNSDLSF